jgi:hypothetical protein
MHNAFPEKSRAHGERLSQSVLMDMIMLTKKDTVHFESM